MLFPKDFTPIVIGLLNIVLPIVVKWKSITASESTDEALAQLESEKHQDFYGILYALTPLWPLMVNLLVIQYLFFPLSYYGTYSEESQQKMAKLLEKRHELHQAQVSEQIAQQLMEIEEELQTIQASNKLLCRSETRRYINKAGVFDLYYTLVTFLIRALPPFKSDPLFQKIVETSIIFSAFIHTFFVLKE